MTDVENIQPTVLEVRDIGRCELGPAHLSNGSDFGIRVVDWST